MEELKKKKKKRNQKKKKKKRLWRVQLTKCLRQSWSVCVCALWLMFVPENCHFSPWCSRTFFLFFLFFELPVSRVGELSFCWIFFFLQPSHFYYFLIFFNYSFIFLFFYRNPSKTPRAFLILVINTSFSLQQVGDVFSVVIKTDEPICADT